MGSTTILQLPQVTGLTGTESLEGVQAGTSVQILASQLAVLALSGASQIASAVPAAGGNNNYTASGLMGPTVGWLELSPSASCSLTGLQAGYDGQMVGITNLTTQLLVIYALNSSSSAANQFRMQGPISLVQYQTAFFKYSATIAKWILIQ
jgi:hypothetical protein